MPERFPGDAAVAAADNEHMLGRLEEREQRPMGDPFMIDPLVFFGQLDDAVEDEDAAQSVRLQYHQPLKSRLGFRDDDLGDLEPVGHVRIKLFEEPELTAFLD